VKSSMRPSCACLDISVSRSTGTSPMRCLNGGTWTNAEPKRCLSGALIGVSVPLGTAVAMRFLPAGMSQGCCRCHAPRPVITTQVADNGEPAVRARVALETANAACRSRFHAGIQDVSPWRESGRFVQSEGLPECDSCLTATRFAGDEERNTRGTQRFHIVQTT